MNLFLGRDQESGRSVWLPLHSFHTHWHLIGGTGKGKTTAIEAILHQLLLALHPAAHFIFDRMGSFSHSLLLWFASPYCPQWVRDRVIYIDASREDVIPTFNPLQFDTPAHGYFKTQRAGECILRAWASQNIEEMPRLARWTFNAMWAAAQLGLTVADCVHLLMPGSPYHEPILDRLPELLRAEWAEILQARGGEASRILESSRNRLKPFFDNPILRGMFGSRENRLDVLRFMREGRIVIVNLAPQNRLSPQLADAIGGMLLNEVLATARSLPFGVRYPTYLWLDEFQRFVGPDIEEAIPEVRQLGIRLILSHQSFSQLKQGDTDLTSLIWQPQSRMMFGVQGEDADILAHELATLTFEPEKIKDKMYSRRQLLKEQRIIQLASWSESQSAASNWQTTYGSNWSNQNSHSAAQGWNAADATECEFWLD
ncbi:MAG: type IV secretory system conjugative DNA transfer family protein, partial [Planctomycetes bacterium]|nr:type IV secretory system conjugative DNA transfer family protein [Planctomycetota bacterium]